MDYYAALIHKEDDSDYGVSFPDFPGCVTAAETYEKAIALAAEALSFHVEGMQADGLKIPAPRTLVEIAAANEDWVHFKETHIFTMVPLFPAPAAKPQATNLSLDPSLVEAVDQYAAAAKMTRSAVFAEGARLLLQSRIPVRANAGRVAEIVGDRMMAAAGGSAGVGAGRKTAPMDLPVRNRSPKS